jgi:hypothetical protein
VDHICIGQSVPLSGLYRRSRAALQLCHQGAAVSGTRVSSRMAWEACDARGYPPHPHRGVRPAVLPVVTVQPHHTINPVTREDCLSRLRLTNLRGWSGPTRHREVPPHGPITRRARRCVWAIPATGQRVAAECGVPGKTHPDHTPKPADQTCYAAGYGAPRKPGALPRLARPAFPSLTARSWLPTARRASGVTGPACCTVMLSLMSLALITIWSNSWVPIRTMRGVPLGAKAPLQPSCYVARCV